MKAQVVYISCGEGFEPADIQRALDDVRAALKLPRDTILFGIPVDQAQIPVAESKPIIGKLSKLNNVIPRRSDSEDRGISAESDSVSNDLEDILGDISPLSEAEPAPSVVKSAAKEPDSEFPQSVHDLAEEMGGLSDDDFEKINESLIKKTAKGVSDLLNVIPFRTKRRKGKAEPGGPNLFDWAGGPANGADDDKFDFPDALKGLI
ncbi:MAG: hypothetical protein LBH81_02540 [Rickettsiales bacterium]|nr:hypothetical protein [Rickettsiales bacterium]